MYRQTSSYSAITSVADMAPAAGCLHELAPARRATPDRCEAAFYRHRYADLADRDLADRLATEDAAVEAGLSPFERLTCPLHRRWLYKCIASPEHVMPTTGHRWCRSCATPTTVAIDELCGDITMTCPRCGRTPDTIATRQITRACRASLATAHR